jgi:hypothetical protein
MSQLEKQAPLDRPVTCANCEWMGTESRLREISDFWGRVDVGGEMPAGECPECQALAYLVYEDNPYAARKDQTVLRTVYGVLADLIEWDARMGGHEAKCWNQAREAMEWTRKVLADNEGALVREEQ